MDVARVLVVAHSGTETSCPLLLASQRKTNDPDLRLRATWPQNNCPGCEMGRHSPGSSMLPCWLPMVTCKGSYFSHTSGNVIEAQTCGGSCQQLESDSQGWNPSLSDTHAHFCYCSPGLWPKEIHNPWDTEEPCRGVGPGRSSCTLPSAQSRAWAGLCGTQPLEWGIFLEGE